MTPRVITRYKNAVLGQRFDLSFSTVTPSKMRAINKRSRGINKATDILSFPLSKDSGEIIICMSEVKSHAKLFGMTANDYLPYLLIHGLIHLKGLAHGRTMDRLEKKFCSTLRVRHPNDIHGTTNRSRHRRRHTPGPRRRRA